MGPTSHSSRAAPPPPPTATATWELALTSPFLDLLAGCCIVEPRRPSQSREARGNKSSHAPHGLACQPPPSLPSLPPTETQPLAHTRKSDDQRTQPTTRGGADPDPKMLAAGGSRGGVPCAAAPALVAVVLLALSAVAAADFFSPLAPIFSPVISKRATSTLLSPDSPKSEPRSLTILLIRSQTPYAARWPAGRATARWRRARWATARLPPEMDAAPCRR